ncbi:MAG: hypothetical protein GF383_08580, partial [Candidatus Lokiarchaeota archaeon]|nr:hypothetical protein [Candidatus Lokiarchaeota archaeon]MBD3340428.1 hypothetical protein [Candidatus Lokiarchaeota archaeon]
MNKELDVYELASYALRKAEKLSSSFKCVELYFGKSKYINIEVEENSVKNSEMGEDYGMSTRAIDGRGSLGFSYTNDLDKNSIEKIVSDALKMMKYGTGDPDFNNLPGSFDTYPNIGGLYDRKQKIIDIEDSLSYVNQLIKICDNDELAISQTADFVSNYYEKYIFNSNGLEASGKSTACSISSNIIVKDKTTKETSFGYEWQIERSLDTINAQK